MTCSFCQSAFALEMYSSWETPSTSADTVTVAVTARQLLGQVSVTVTITNTGAGHQVPTDFPGRHMILVVTATDENGADLERLSGPTVPTWGGAQAGLPGKAFAKVLEDVQTGQAPVVSYWKQTRIASDNRIPALGSDRSSYRFSVPSASGTVTVTAGLRFRRVFQEVIDERGWDKEDIPMEQAQIVLGTADYQRIMLPLVLRNTPTGR